MNEHQLAGLMAGEWLDGVCPPALFGPSASAGPTGGGTEKERPDGFEVIPQDPTRPEYRQGGTLGADHKHWFRAKFFQQYRLFFRYHAQSRVIVLAWVNDERTLRAYESGDDAYRVFRKMLDSGHPPDDWDSLLAEARAEAVRLSRRPRASP
jgi:hypothetical protein